MQAFLSAVAAGNPPDVIHIDRAEVGTYAARDALEPVDQYVEAGGFDVGVFREAALAPLQFEDGLYGLPQFNNVIVAYLNDAALEEAGLTPDDIAFSDWGLMEQINERLTERSGGEVQRVGFDPRMPDYTPLWAVANGGGLISDDGTEILLDTPEVVEAVEYTAGLREATGGQQAYQAYSETWDIFGSENPIVADQVGVTLFEQWWLGVLLEASPDVELTVVPFQRHGAEEPVTFAGGLAFSIPAGADDPRLAWEFIKFMSSEDTWVAAAEADRRRIEQEGGLYVGTFTANRAADERIMSEVYEPTGRAAVDEAVQVILDVQDDAASFPAHPVGAPLQDAWERAVREVLLGERSAEEALAAADAEVQQALDEVLAER